MQICFCIDEQYLLRGQQYVEGKDCEGGDEAPKWEAAALHITSAASSKDQGHAEPMNEMRMHIVCVRFKLKNHLCRSLA